MDREVIKDPTSSVLRLRARSELEISSVLQETPQQTIHRRHSAPISQSALASRNNSGKCGHEKNATLVITPE